MTDGETLDFLTQRGKTAKLVTSVCTGSMVHEYARTKLEYSSSIIKSIPPALDSISRDKNRGQVDVGLYWHPFTFSRRVWPFKLNERKTFPQSGFVFEPLRIDTPLAREVADVASSSSTPQRIRLDRTRRQLMRVGYRVQTAKSHFESGLEGGWQYGSLVRIDTSQGPCIPSPSESFGTCLANLSPPVTGIIQIRETRTKEAFYTDWGWKTPLPFLSQWSYQVQAQGEWFPFGPGNDNSSDTRYRFDLDNSIKIPITGSLSFQPEVEYFRYHNKFGADTLKRWMPSAKLTWSFDRYSGESWWKAMKHDSSGGGDE